MRTLFVGRRATLIAKTFLLANILIATLFAATTPANARPPLNKKNFEEGQQLFQMRCAGCHGTYMTDIASPSLFKQNLIYLERELHKFANKNADDDPLQLRHDFLFNGAMNTIAYSLSAADNQKLLYYLANTDECMADDSLPDNSDFELGKQWITTQMCFACHHAGNRWDAPKIKGQKFNFLVYTLTIYSQKQRHSQFMNGLVKNFSPEIIQSVAAYLSRSGACLAENAKGDYLPHD